MIGRFLRRPRPHERRHRRGITGPGSSHARRRHRHAREELV